jgi:hypothetical protein
LQDSKSKGRVVLYLLQKREETAISLAATEPNARVIDDATKYHFQRKHHLAGLLMGLLIPFESYIQMIYWTPKLRVD